jgi:hypothetical protein
MNCSFLGCGEERTASFAIDAVPIVTASYGPELPKMSGLAGGKIGVFYKIRILHLQFLFCYLLY